MRLYLLLSAICFVPLGAQSDSELSPHHPSEVRVDRGYTSDSEVYTEHNKTRIPRSTTDMDVASSGWLVVSTNIHKQQQKQYETNILFLEHL